MTELMTQPIVMTSFSTTNSRTTPSPIIEGTEAEYSDTIGIDLDGSVEGQLDLPDESSQWALEWLSSDNAKEYEGLWVALGPGKQVFASGPSPSALRKAVDEHGDSVILYVIPEHAQIIGGGRFIAFAS